MADGSGQTGFLFAGVAAEAVAAETRESREKRRSRRKRAVRSKTLSVAKALRSDAEALRLHYGEPHDRPATRAECPGPGEDGKRRCPFVGCRYALYLDVNPVNGSVKFNTPEIEPGEAEHGCALDVADEGGMTLEATGAILNLTRERIRQIERKAIAKLLASDDPAAKALAEYAMLRDDDGKRRLPVVKNGRATVGVEPGRRYGGVVTIEPAPRSSNGHVMWRCRCDCGGEFDARASELAARRTRSCKACLPRAPALGELRPLTGPDPSQPQAAPTTARERALLRAAERLGRFSAAHLLRASGMGPGDEWHVDRMAASGAIKRDGDAYVWIGFRQAAELWSCKLGKRRRLCKITHGANSWAWRWPKRA